MPLNFFQLPLLLLLGRVLDVWMDKMGCVTQHDRKKLLALALCSLLPLVTDGGNSGVVGSSSAPSSSDLIRTRIFAILTSITEVLNDITRTEEDTGTIIE